MAAFKKGSSAGKGTPTGASIRATDEDGGPKPLSTAILQELQSLKEKFKNEDDEQVKGSIYSFIFYFYLIFLIAIFCRIPISTPG